MASYPFQNANGMGWLCRFDTILTSGYGGFALCAAGSISSPGTFPAGGKRALKVNPDSDKINANLEFMHQLKGFSSSKNVTISGTANEPVKVSCPRGKVLKHGSCAVDAKPTFVYSYPESISSWLCYSDQPVVVSIECVNSSKVTGKHL